VEPTVLPNGNYYLPETGEVIPADMATPSTQGTKLIDTCVLYIDIRRSTDLNLSHKPVTVAKLYSAFVRSGWNADQQKHD
jgi:class 3 adenylate cyclase